MINDNKKPNSNPQRQAKDIIRGFDYQHWYSVLTWLELNEREFLYLENAEDFEVVEQEKISLTQVKDTSKNLTLGSESAIEAINNFWEIRQLNPNKKLKYVYLTRSSIGKEKGSPFGKDIFGINLWLSKNISSKSIEKIASFLAKKPKINEDLSNFLKKEHHSIIKKELIDPIHWITESENVECVEALVNEYLIYEGDRHGVSPSKSKKMATRLYKEVVDCASGKKNKPLTKAYYLEIIEEELTLRLPPSHIRDILKYSSMKQNSSLEIGFQESFAGVIGQPSDFKEYISKHIKRSRLMDESMSILENNTALCFTGATGVGKTSVATAIGLSLKDCCWLSLPLNSNEEKKSALIIGLQYLTRNPQITNMIIDGYNLDPIEKKNSKTILGSILTLINARNGSLILTSYKGLSSEIKKDFFYLGLKELSVSIFDEEDIFSVLKQYECPKHLMNPWKLAIMSQTSGHPQLVHARVQKLSQDNWPDVSNNDVYITPVEIKKEKKEAQEYLLDLLTEKEKIALCYLSIFFQNFRRDQALIMIEHIDDFCGNLFDRLIGQYIEPSGDKYFKVSPLIEGMAQEAWSKEKQKKIHALAVKSIYQCKSLGWIEALQLIIHALSSEDEGSLFVALQLFMDAPKFHLEPISHLLLSKSIESNPGFSNPAIKFYLRNVQFRIAAEFHSKKAIKIYNIWKEELPNLNSIPNSRLIFHTETIMRFEVEIPSSELINAFFELFNEGQSEAEKSLIDMKKFSELFSFIFARKTDRIWWDEVLICLEKCSTNFQDFFWNEIEKRPTETKFGIDRIWMIEHEKFESEHDWSPALSTLKNLLEIVKQRTLYSLEGIIYKAMSIIYSEYLDEQTKAIQILNQEPIKGIKSSTYILSAQAKVHFNNDRHSKALKAWEDALENIEEAEIDDLEQIYIIRFASISAFHINNHAKGVRLLTRALELSTSLDTTGLQVGILGDLAFFHWHLKDNKNTINCFIDALDLIKKINKKSDEYKHLLQRINYLIMWMINDSLEDPPPCMCSDPEIKNKVFDSSSYQELPQVLLFLADLESEFKLNCGVFERVKIDLSFPSHSNLSSQFMFLEIKTYLNRGDFKDIPSLLDELEKYETHRLSQENKTNFNIKLYIKTLCCFLLFERIIRQHPIDTFLESASKQSGFFNNFTEDINRVLKLGHYAAKGLLLRKGNDHTIQYLASAKILSIPSQDLEADYIAQAFLFSCLDEVTYVPNVFFKDVTLFLAHRWFSLSKHPAFFRAPNLFIPIIKDFCNKSDPQFIDLITMYLSIDGCTTTRLSTKFLQIIKKFI